jgi:hypothetical protein
MPRISKHYYVSDGVNHLTMTRKRNAIRLTQQFLQFIDIDLKQREIQWYMDNAPNTKFTSERPEHDGKVVEMETYTCDECSGKDKVKLIL